MAEAVFNLGFDGVAVVADDGREVSYADLKQMTEEWAAKVPPRSLVFLLVGNNLDSLVAYVACLNHGIVPLMLDAKIDGQLLQRFIEIYRPDFIWRPSSEGYVLEEGLRTSDFRHPALFEDLALLLTTSGSTGSPKLVRQSYKNIKANTASIVEYLRLDSTERPITTLPMNYTYGLSIVNSHLTVGATILLTEKSIMQREFWNFFTEQGTTSFGGVPYTYEMLDKLMFFRRKLPSLRTMTQAGGKILPTLHQKFAEYAKREGKNFVVMYGQCEATARMSYLPPERALDKVGSMGIAIPGGRFSLIDVDGRAINEPDITGELVYDGANVTLGYAECADDLSKGDERHGRLVTGDMARRDTDGFYYIVGRKKRFLKIFGNRVNLDETERLIKGAFPDLDCACGGIDDKMKIFITDETQVQSIRDFVAEKTHLNFTAFDVRPIVSIPKNESGKTLYSELPIS
ncbi:MAG: AMP-binding protein [Kiritimatiellae bacterium]|nr:AMP-binding protein [Kiritimatiellia bacterium]